MADGGRQVLVGVVTFFALIGTLLILGALWRGPFATEDALGLKAPSSVWVPLLIFGLLLTLPAVGTLVLANKTYSPRSSSGRSTSGPSDTMQAVQRDPTTVHDCPVCRKPESLACRLDTRETEWCSCRRCGALLRRKTGTSGYEEVGPRQWERGIARTS